MPTVPIYDEICYGFDCLVQCGDITADVYHYFMSYSDFNVNDWYDKLQRPNVCNPHEYQSFCNYHKNQSTQAYLDWFYHDTTLRRGACTAQGLLNFEWRFNEIVNSVVYNGITQLHHEQKTDAQIIEQLTDPTRITDFARTNSEFQNFEVNWMNVVNRAKYLGSNHMQEALQFEEEQSQLRQQKRDQQLEEISNRINDDNEFLTRNMLDWCSRLSRKQKREKKQKRKAVIRSLNVLELFSNKKTIQLFISGQDIQLQGQNFDFVIKKRNLYSNQHHAVNVCVTNKSGVKLVDLCWYTKDTFSAEQVVSLMLAAAHGNENEIIGIGNITCSHNVQCEDYETLMTIHKEYRQTNKRDDEDQDIPGIVAFRDNEEWRVLDRLRDQVQTACFQHIVNAFSSPSLRTLVTQPRNAL